jgi:hypothetical protein
MEAGDRKWREEVIDEMKQDEANSCQICGNRQSSPLLVHTVLRLQTISPNDKQHSGTQP